MEIRLEDVVRNYLALRGESPGLLPELADGEDSAVLTLADALRVRLLPEAVAATVMTPPALLVDVAVPRDPRVLPGPGFLKPCGLSAYIPFPTFDGETLAIGRAAYYRMLKALVV